MTVDFAASIRGGRMTAAPPDRKLSEA